MIKFMVRPKGTNLTATSPVTPFFYPAGEAHVKAPENFDPEDYDYHVADMRGFSHDDLFALAMWENLLGPEAKKVVLLPYLPAARADRGEPFGAYVYAEFFNSLFIDQIITIDPHSPVAPSLYEDGDAEGGHGNNVIIFSFERILKREIQASDDETRPQTYAGVIAPDKGAVLRATRAAKVMGVPVFRAEKTRNFETGKLDGFHMIDELPGEGKFLIVDDICDGGGTFIGLADAIGLPNTRLDLWITHGIFSKGIEELAKRFGTIHTTNSYFDKDKTFAPPYLKVHDLAPYLYGEINV